MFSSASSNRVEGAEKHEIYMATFGSHLFLLAATKLAKVIFSQACVKNSVHREGLPQCMPPREQTPPPPGADTPPEQTPPAADTPQEQTPPGSRLQHTVNERPVCILLECILVMTYIQRAGVAPPLPG